MIDIPDDNAQRNIAVPQWRPAEVMATLAGHLMDPQIVDPVILRDDDGRIGLFYEVIVGNPKTGVIVAEFRAEDAYAPNKAPERSALVWGMGSRFDVPIPIDKATGVISPEDIERQLSPEQVGQAVGWLTLLRFSVRNPMIKNGSVAE
jgi:hypothetical protein